MTVREFKQYLNHLPSTYDALEVVFGSRACGEDQFVKAAPWEPEEVAIAGVGVQRAVIVGADLARHAPRSHNIRVGAKRAARLARLNGGVD